jgi:3-hydroxyisobutyrate dehydrogenase
MTSIAWLGLGAMGARMASRALQSGHHITVYNRDTQKTDALVALGARRANTPRGAAAHADIVVSMVRDDDASRAVWLDEKIGALASMKPGAIAIECSTLSVAWMNELRLHCDAHDIALCDAPVVGSRGQADSGQLIFLLGGRTNQVTLAQHFLGTIGGAVHHTGEPGSGTVTKLFVNAMFGAQLATLAELIAMTRHCGFDPQRVLGVFSATAVASPAANAAAAAMLAGQFAPMFPVSLAEKDFGYVVAATESAMPMSTAARAVLQSAVAAGFSEDNITAVAKLY